MQTKKYRNLDETLPELNEVLKDAIQSDKLEISHIDKQCSKFLEASKLHPELAGAEFVVYAPHMRKVDHPFEHFAFLDGRGQSICHISGTEMELYGLLEPCTRLKKSEAFAHELDGDFPESKPTGNRL